MTTVNTHYTMRPSEGPVAIVVIVCAPRCIHGGDQEDDNGMLEWKRDEQSSQENARQNNQREIRVYSGEFASKIKLATRQQCNNRLPIINLARFSTLIFKFSLIRTCMHYVMDFLCFFLSFIFFGVWETVCSKGLLTTAISALKSRISPPWSPVYCTHFDSNRSTTAKTVWALFLLLLTFDWVSSQPI